MQPYLGEAYQLATEECISSSVQRPMQIAGRSFNQYLASWRGYIRSVTVHPMPGTHRTMLDDRHAPTVARLVVRLMRASASPVPST
jgi:thioesterase domain-containing protein